MADLRALLGDRYVSTMRAAVLAYNPEAITSAQRVGGKLGQLMYLSAVERLDNTLAAVLPDLLADAWDEGRKLGLRQADWEYNVTPDPMPELANPYRPETATRDATDAPETPAAPDAINPPPDPSAAVTEPHNTEGA